MISGWYYWIVMKQDEIWWNRMTHEDYLAWCWLPPCADSAELHQRYSAKQLTKGIGRFFKSKTEGTLGCCNDYPFTTVFSPVLLVDYFLVVYACSGRFRRGAKQPVKEAQDWSVEFEGVKGLKEARNPSRRAGKKSKQSYPYVCLPNRSCSNLACSGDQFAEGHQCCQSGLRTKNVLNS